MVVFSHPTGNANVKSAAQGFANARLLNTFYTTVASFEGSIIDRLGSIRFLNFIRRRRYSKDLFPFTNTWPWLECGRMIASKAGLNILLRHEKGLFCIDAVIRNHDKHVAYRLNRGVKNNVKAVYAYEDCAYYSFEKAKELGFQCLYDLPIGYWRAARRFLESELRKWPEWACTMPGFLDSPEKLNIKDLELTLADQIFVASQFTAKTLKEFPGKLPPVEVIPYGFPETDSKRVFRTSNKGPIKLLYVGSLSQRKGIANLFAAVEPFKKHIELTIVGQRVTTACNKLNEALVYHRWFPSLSHEDVLKLMKQHDVLVFPSLFEGFGLVITEAMSQGTPVITTERTAGPDFIEHNYNGWLFEAGETHQLQVQIEALILNQNCIRNAGKAAMETARMRPWRVYSDELSKAVGYYLNA